LSGGIAPEIAQLTNLASLVLGFNSFAGEPLPANVGLVKSLEILDLQGNNYTGPIPQSYDGLDKLQKLNLRVNKLSGVIPAFFGNYTALEELEMTESGVNGTVPVELSTLTRLIRLFFHLNPLTGLMPQEICDLKSSASLQTLIVTCFDVPKATPPNPGVVCPVGCCLCIR
jgi:Leucine-rich repeat (LRR) protein